MSKEAMKLALEALERYQVKRQDFDRFADEITSLREALAEQPAQPQESVAWVPYLSDRADGVKGHYAIARWNPRGYREVWNLRSHQWSAYSDDVLSLEEADALLRLITIPTRKVTPPLAQRTWVGLTQDEFRDFASTLEYGTGGLIRAIESKLKEKNA